MNGLTFTAVNEKKRTYIFPDADITFENVTGICVRDSGTHRLELADGNKVIVPAKWIAIVLDGEWKF